METDGPSWQEFANFDALPDAYDGFDADFAHLDPSAALHSSFALPSLPSINYSTSQALGSDLIIAPTANQLLSSRQQLQITESMDPKAGAPVSSRTRPGQSPELARIEEQSKQCNQGVTSPRMSNSRRTTITLEDADSTTLVAVMDILIKSNATVKFEKT